MGRDTRPHMEPEQGDTDWMDNGLCRGQDPNIWFPTPANDRSLQITARQTCRQCPVREECLEYALTHKAQGVWGGTDSIERHAILRARRRRMSIV
jgi:WhiB family redox-sensing transcriptional regulator